MKALHIFVVLFAIALIVIGDSHASKNVGGKKKKTTFVEEEKKLRELLNDEEENQEPRDIFDMMNEDEASEEEASASDSDSPIEDMILEENDPCNGIRCGAGRACYPNDVTGLGECQCIKDCGYEPDPRRKVCTNSNETFSTDCEVYQKRCFCEEGVTDKCPDPEKFKHMHVEYFGECRSIPECTAEELVDFPRRMREWLFNVMKELSDRRELSYHYQQLKKEAEEDRSKRWVNAAVWKWCDLDAHPHDNVVSRHELFPIRAPLQALEHCISDFLDNCDTDDNHDITLKEWGTCLELKEEDLMDRCDEMNGKP